MVPGLYGSKCGHVPSASSGLCLAIDDISRKSREYGLPCNLAVLHLSARRYSLGPRSGSAAKVPRGGPPPNGRAKTQACLAEEDWRSFAGPIQLHWRLLLGGLCQPPMAQQPHGRADRRCVALSLFGLVCDRAAEPQL